jgi:hypothetical protein
MDLLFEPRMGIRHDSVGFVTACIRSRRAAANTLCAAACRECGRRHDNRAESSHRPFLATTRKKLTAPYELPLQPEETARRTTWVRGPVRPAIWHLQSRYSQYYTDIPGWLRGATFIPHTKCIVA